MSNTAASHESASEQVGRPRRFERELHPERYVDGPLPRRRTHLTLIRWRLNAVHEWVYECAVGQFEREVDGYWVLSEGRQLRAYDMTVWAVCAN